MPFHIPTFLSSTHAISVVTTLLVFLILNQRRASKRTLPYPPGPRPLPLIGNVLNMPESKFALTFTKFGEEYGPLTWLTLPGQNLLILNSFEAADELLKKRDLTFIDRPRFPMVKELIGLRDWFTFSGYNKSWRTQRSFLERALSAAVVRKDYSSLMEVNAQRYLERCFACPENSRTEIKRTIEETIVRLIFGRLEDEHGRNYVKMTSRITSIIVQAIQGYVVDLLPALRYLPAWLPGMKFKRDAMGWGKEIYELERGLFKSAQENLLLDDPEVQSSFMSKRLQAIYQKYEDTKDETGRADDERALARSGLQLFLGAIDTTHSTSESFIFAMALFPAVQQKAQAEINNVVGSGRLPTFKDQPNLPYLNAVILELLRWNPVISCGMPHASVEDSTYNGYFIPRGTSVISNAWGFSRNPKYYSNPTEFDPERHLKQPPELDPRVFAFGYGRRTCPGKELGFQSLWILGATILWGFEVTMEAEDVAKLQNDPDRFTFGMMNFPNPFKCQLVPRHKGLPVADASGLGSSAT